MLPPLIFRQIIDTAIPAGDKRQIWLLAGLAVGAAIVDALLAIVQRWCSARIGEGLICDLRVALFGKVQRMPIAFFTRTQTGALSSRLNNDVVGAQNAVTSTLGSVVSNVVVLAATLAAMLALEWRLTMLALIVLPLFVVPAKRVGRKLPIREQMNTNAEMNSQMAERFNVAGAQLVKLFGRSDDERAVLDQGIHGPRHRHQVGDVRAGLLRRPRAGRGPRRSRHLWDRRQWSAATSSPERSLPWPHSSPVCTSRSPG